MSKQTSPKSEQAIPVDEFGRLKVERVFFKSNVFVGVDNTPLTSLVNGGDAWAQSQLSFDNNYRFLRIVMTKAGRTTTNLVPIENISSFLLELT